MYPASSVSHCHPTAQLRVLPTNHYIWVQRRTTTDASSNRAAPRNYGRMSLDPLGPELGSASGKGNGEASVLKAVAMVTSSPRITVPLCLATEREKARQRWGETVDGGEGGWGRGSGGSKDVPSRDQQDKRKQCGSIQKSEHTNHKMSHISLYRPFARA